MTTSIVSSGSGENYDNPYFLSNGDQMNLTLVSDRLTGPADFNSWFCSMSMELEGRNKLGYVDGTFPKPDDSHPDAKLWSRNNIVIRSWILNSVSKDIASSLLYTKISKEMWQILIRRYQQSSAPRLYSIRRKLRTLAQGHLDVTTYFTKLVAIWEELKSLQIIHMCVCGNCSCRAYQRNFEQIEQNFVIDFLFGLNDSYESVRSQILLIEPLPDLQKTFHLLTQHEEQKLIKSVPDISDNPVFQVSSSPDGLIAAVPGNLNKPRQKPLCTHCGVYGHTIQKCYKLHGYPPGWKHKSVQRDSSTSVNED